MSLMVPCRLLPISLPPVIALAVERRVRLSTLGLEAAVRKARRTKAGPLRSGPCSRTNSICQEL